MHRVGSSRRRGDVAGWVFIAALGVLISGAESVAGTVRAGAATTNISPWIGLSMNGGMSDNPVKFIHDELHARAFVIDDGSVKVAFVICDSCMIPRDVVTEAKARIQKHSQIDPSHVLISATHAHSCPTAGHAFQSDPAEEYRKLLAIRIADAVELGVKNLAPAKIGWGFGKNAEQIFNRRWKMKPGTIAEDPFGRKTDRVKMNPAAGSPDLIEPAGPVDPDVPVIAIQTLSGRPMALLATYSLHYVGGVGPGHASADYFGVFAEMVKQKLGAEGLDPPFVAAMANGTSGDVNNINFRVAKAPLPAYAQIRHVAEELSTEAVRVARSIEYHDQVTLDARAEELRLKVRKPDHEDIARAEAIVKRAKGPAMAGLDEVYARETMLIDKYPNAVDVTVQAIRVGPVGIVAIPCEVFTEIGLEIKAKSAIRPVFTIELANGYNGYLPTRAQHALGGYETWRARSSYLDVGAAEAITATALKLLNEVRSEARP